MLPCLDEAAALPAVLATLPDWPVLVVDNGSTDDTAAATSEPSPSSTATNSARACHIPVWTAAP